MKITPNNEKKSHLEYFALLVNFSAAGVAEGGPGFHHPPNTITTTPLSPESPFLSTYCI
jgi:hypothetical protein